MKNLEKQTKEIQEIIDSLTFDEKLDKMLFLVALIHLTSHPMNASALIEMLKYKKLK